MIMYRPPKATAYIAMNTLAKSRTLMQLENDELIDVLLRGSDYFEKFCSENSVRAISIDSHSCFRENTINFKGLRLEKLFIYIAIPEETLEAIDSGNAIIKTENNTTYKLDFSDCIFKFCNITISTRKTKLVFSGTWFIDSEVILNTGKPYDLIFFNTQFANNSFRKANENATLPAGHSVFPNIETCNLHIYFNKKVGVNEPHQLNFHRCTFWDYPITIDADTQDKVEVTFTSSHVHGRRINLVGSTSRDAARNLKFIETSLISVLISISEKNATIELINCRKINKICISATPLHIIRDFNKYDHTINIRIADTSIFNSEIDLVCTCGNISNCDKLTIENSTLESSQIRLQSINKGQLVINESTFANSTLAGNDSTFSIVEVKNGIFCESLMSLEKVSADQLIIYNSHFSPPPSLINTDTTHVKIQQLSTTVSESKKIGSGRFETDIREIQPHIYAALRKLVEKHDIDQIKTELFAQNCIARYYTDLKGVKSWPFRAYKNISDFGRSLSRPLIGLLAQWALFSIAYTLLSPKNNLESGALLSTAHSLPLFGQSKFLLKNISENFEPCLMMLSLGYVQEALSLLLIFLIGLALRNKLKIS